MQARYDARNPAAMKKLIEGGAQLRMFSRDILLACQKEAFALYGELAAANPAFRKVFEPWNRFRSGQHLWTRIAENSVDAFVGRHPAE